MRSRHTDSLVFYYTSSFFFFFFFFSAFHLSLLFLPLHLFFFPLFDPSWELHAVQGILPQVPAFALIRPALIASPSNPPIIPRIQSFECKCLTGASVQRRKKKDKHRKRTQSAYTRPVSYQLSYWGALHASADLQLSSRLHRVPTSAVHPLFKIKNGCSKWIAKSCQLGPWPGPQQHRAVWQVWAGAQAKGLRHWGPGPPWLAASCHCSWHILNHRKHRSPDWDGVREHNQIPHV